MRVQIPGLRIVEDEEPRESTRGPGAPPSPGSYLREQRLRRGMTLEELSEITKIPRASLEALEEERYEGLPGPVFVKGFLRCCARALEVDGDTVIDLLYEQERARVRANQEKEREKAPAPNEAATATPVAAAMSTAGATATPRVSAARLGARLAEGARGLLGAAGDLAARLPRSNLLMWIVVGLLVLGVVFAVYVAAGSQRLWLPQS